MSPITSALLMAALVAGVSCVVVPVVPVAVAGVASTAQQQQQQQAGAGGQQQQQQQQSAAAVVPVIPGYVAPYGPLGADLVVGSPLTAAIAAGSVAGPNALHPLAPVSQEGYQCPKGWCYSQGIFCGYNVCPDVQGFKNLYYCKGYGWAPKLVDSCSLACVDSRKGQDSCYPL